jgi:hypothetical protein
MGVALLLSPFTQSLASMILRLSIDMGLAFVFGMLHLHHGL